MRLSVILGTCAVAAIALPLSTGAVAQRGQDSDRGSVSRLDRAGSMGELRQGKESIERFQSTTVGTRIRQADPHHPTTDPHGTTDPHHPTTDPHGTTDPHHPTADPHGTMDPHHSTTDPHGTTDPHHPMTDPHGSTDPHHTTTDPHDTDPHHTTPG